MSAGLGVHLVRESAPVLAVLRADRARLQALVRRRLARTLLEAARAPLHRDRRHEAGVDDALIRHDPFAALRALPPLDKAALRAAGDAALRDGRPQPGWYVSQSSGSTGEPFTVRFDPRAWAILKHLVKVRGRLACGVRPLDRVAILDAISADAEGRALAERTGRVRRISVFRPAPEIAEMLAEFAPAAVYGLPTALLEAGRALPPMRRSIRVFTGGELLPPSVRVALAESYRGPVHDCYGTSETKEIAWECRAGSAHVNADVIHVEVLGDDGQPAPPGAEGAIVATVLVNTAMPLVRYRTGDRGRLLDGRCSCGLALPRLGVVTGREADVLEVEGRRVSPYALTTALERVGGLERYQVTQTERGRLRVRAVPATGADPAVLRHRVPELLGAEIGVPLRIDVELLDRFHVPAGRKFRVVEPLAAPSAPREPRS